MGESRPSKRERTRRKLIDAGLHVIAERGAALTASDVVVAADVSNGTFYNHFVDRDDFIQSLAHESLLALADRSAEETDGSDPAWRFAVATTRVLDTACRQPLWGRAVLRLADCPTSMHDAIREHLRADLADGLRLGRFDHGDDPVTVDLVLGTVLASIRRLVGDGDGRVADDQADRAAVVDVVARLLQAIGVDGTESHDVASRAFDAERPVPPVCVDE